MKQNTAKIIGGIAAAMGTFSVIRYFWVLKIYLDFLEVMSIYRTETPWQIFSEMPNSMLVGGLLFIVLGLIAIKHETKNILAAKIILALFGITLLGFIALAIILISFGVTA